MSRFRLSLILPVASLVVACAMPLPGKVAVPTQREGVVNTGLKGTPVPGRTPDQFIKASPTQGKSPTAKPTATAEPEGTDTRTCTVPAAIAENRQALSLDSHTAIAGLNFQAAGGALAAPELKLKLGTYPGSGEVEVKTAVVVFSLARAGGAVTTAPIAVPISFGKLPAAPANAWGTPVEIPLRLPTGVLRSVLKAEDAGVALTAQVRFIEVNGFEAFNEKAEPFEIALPLAMGATATPAMASRIAPCPIKPAEYGPVSPVVTETGDAPLLASGLAFDPPTGLTYGPGLSAGAVTLLLAAPPGAGSVQLTKAKVVYTWPDGDGTDRETAPETLTFDSVITVPAATLERYGQPVEVAVPVSASVFSEIPPESGMVTMTVEFEDMNGYAVLDHNFQNLQMSVPIYLK